MTLNRFRNWFRVLLYSYLAISIPIVGIFILSPYVRFVALNTVAHWRAKTIGVHAVFVGDSIVAGGRCWTGLSPTPFSIVNLAVGGATVRQIEWQFTKATQYETATVYILAGTNDILSDDFNEATFRTDYDSLLKKASDGRRVVVTLIPYTADNRYRSSVESANRIISALCEKRKIRCVDLNPAIAPQGVLLEKFTTDGVHLSKTAYQVWVTLLNSK